MLEHERFKLTYRNLTQEDTSFQNWHQQKKFYWYPAERRQPCWHWHTYKAQHGPHTTPVSHHWGASAGPYEDLLILAHRSTSVFWQHLRAKRKNRGLSSSIFPGRLCLMVKDLCWMKHDNMVDTCWYADIADICQPSHLPLSAKFPLQHGTLGQRALNIPLIPCAFLKSITWKCILTCLPKALRHTPSKDTLGNEIPRYT